MPDILVVITVACGAFVVIGLMLFRPSRMPIGMAVREAIETFFLILIALILAWIVTSFTHFK